MNRMVYLLMILVVATFPVAAFAQTVASAPATTSAIAPSETHTGSQLAVNMIVVMLMERVKQSKWFPWINASSGSLNRFVSVLLAGVAAFGVHTTFDRTAGVLTITGLTLSGIASAGWLWLKSYAFQHSIYKATSLPKGGA